MHTTEQNVLSYLLKNENSFTEALYGLLSYKFFRDCVINFLTQSHLKDIYWENISTQTTIEGFRPDIHIASPTTDILIEIKTNVYTQLTDNQPDAYAEWLERQLNKNNNFLIFLIPGNYKHKRHLQDRIKTTGKNISQNVRIYTVTWESLISHIRQSELEKNNIYINDFISCIESQIDIPRLEFTQQESEMLYNRQYITLLRKIILLVDEVIKSLDEERYSLNKVQKRYFWNDEYCVYIYYKDEPILWFGIWSDFWEKRGVPLAYGIGYDWGDDLIESFQKYNMDYIKYPTDHSEYYLLKGIQKDILESSEPEINISQLLHKNLKYLTAVVDDRALS